MRGAVLWRSGSQIAAQLVTWTATFLVIRLLNPADYGLFAMTQVVLMFLSLMNGYGFANALVRSETVTPLEIRQMFGLLHPAQRRPRARPDPAGAARRRLFSPADGRDPAPRPGPALRRDTVHRPAAGAAQPPDRLSRPGADGAGLGPAQRRRPRSAAPRRAGASGRWWRRRSCCSGARRSASPRSPRSLVWPSFRFRGAGHHIRYGGAMVAIQCFWFVQSQADVFIAGRLVVPHQLGLYTISLFLTQILAGKFVPPINEVSFAAYARIQDRRTRVAAAFLKTVRLVMLIALPFYFGLAIIAGPVVLTVLGPEICGDGATGAHAGDGDAVPDPPDPVRAATNALGRPRAALRVAMAGAVIMPPRLPDRQPFRHDRSRARLAVRLPVAHRRHGGHVAAGDRREAPGPRPRHRAGAVRQRGDGGGGAALDSALPVMTVQARLAILASVGVSLYGGLLFAFARPLVEEVIGLALGRSAPAATPAQAL